MLSSIRGLVFITLAIASSVVVVARAAAKNSNSRTKRRLPRLIFLGTGCSGGTPIALCMLGLIPGRPEAGCHICRSAYQDPTHPNHRRNPCVLLQNADRNYNALIDCGKTFREAALTWFP